MESCPLLEKKLERLLALTTQTVRYSCGLMCLMLLQSLLVLKMALDQSSLLLHTVTSLVQMAILLAQRSIRYQPYASLIQSQCSLQRTTLTTQFLRLELSKLALGMLLTIRLEQMERFLCLMQRKFTKLHLSLFVLT